MKLALHSSCGIRTARRTSAFTMVEVALALGVIAFAMVAIMGVLPTGLRVQKDNREQTTINFDGPYFLEAIRSGARGMDDLTNYVDWITVSNRFRTFRYTNPYVQGQPKTDGPITNGYQIIGRLSTPKYVYNRNGSITESLVTAQVRAVAGSALQRINRDPTLAKNGLGVDSLPWFTYLMTVELVSPTILPTELTNLTTIPRNAPLADKMDRTNTWRRAVESSANMYELRLVFQWPVFYRNGAPFLGKNRKVFRTTISGTMTNDNGFLFLQPASYLKASP